MVFNEWLDQALSGMKNDERIKALCFNIYEECDINDADGNETYTLQLVGSSYYDEENDDWACDTLYSTGEFLFCFVSKGWEAALNDAVEFIKSYLENGSSADLLKKMEAVCVGFTDGDLICVSRNG